MTMRYEWDVETANADGDVEEHYHCESAAEALRYMQSTKAPTGGRLSLVLVRDRYYGNDGAGLSRSWAYVADGRLPTWCDGGHRIPKQFHEELAQARNGERK